MKIIPVDGYDGLARDVETGSIVNINTSEIERARIRKKARQQQKQAAVEAKARREQLEQRVDNIEQKLDTILSILSQQHQKK